jgi:hypothetical protein
MYYSQRKHKKVLAMEDSDAKLGQLEILGLSLGIFDKQSITNECHRLRNLGYISLAERYLMSKSK